MGLAVDCIYYRSPYLLARQAADVDRLSNGRLVLGLGIGHVKPEFHEMGIPFPPTAERLQGMEETIAIVRGLFTGEPFAFEGKQWSVDSPGTFLPPVQQPRVPILLAGGGEKVTLRQVAQYADASNMGAHGSIGMAVSDDDIRRKFRVLEGYCEQFGRPADSVLRSQFTMPLVLGRNQKEIDQKLSAMASGHRRLLGRCDAGDDAGQGNRVLPRAGRARLSVLHRQHSRHGRRHHRSARHARHAKVHQCMSVPTTASILIVNYNYGRFLADTIDSALGQTWPNVQVVVVDDGSTDESQLIMQSYGDAIQTVFKDNGGQASGTNTGFPLLTGETVILLDSDDVLETNAIEKTIGIFADPDVIKVCWPFTIIDRHGKPTGETRFTRLPNGNYRANALKIGPASHYTPAQSGNFWRKSFLDQVMPVPEDDFKNIVDAYLFAFSPFFGSFRAVEEPLTRYRVHGSNISAQFSAVRRREDWEKRATHLHAYLTEQGEEVSIEQWRRKNKFYRRLDGIAKAEARIGAFLPKDAPLALIGGPHYDRTDIHPLRPVHRAPDSFRAAKRTERDFRDLIAQLRSNEIGFLAVQGSATWNGTNLGVLAELLRTEYLVLFENEWLLLADIREPSASTTASGEDAPSTLSLT